MADSKRELELGRFRGCEIADNGETITLSLTDKQGNALDLRLPLEQAGLLSIALPSVLQNALQKRSGNDDLKYAYKLATWELAPIDDPEFQVLTLSVNDGSGLNFIASDEALQQLGLSLVSHSRFRLVARAH